jgi:hypothetical protein
LLPRCGIGKRALSANLGTGRQSGPQWRTGAGRLYQRGPKFKPVTLVVASWQANCLVSRIEQALILSHACVRYHSPGRSSRGFAAV